MHLTNEILNGTYKNFVLNPGLLEKRAGTYRAGTLGTGPGPFPVFRSDPVPGIPGFRNAPKFVPPMLVRLVMHFRRYQNVINKSIINAREK